VSARIDTRATQTRQEGANTVADTDVTIVLARRLDRIRTEMADLFDSDVDGAIRPDVRDLIRAELDTARALFVQHVSGFYPEAKLTDRAVRMLNGLDRVIARADAGKPVTADDILAATNVRS
jgi:hypothetical protein